jgi:cytochrome c biogenesis protein ResB
MKKGGNNQAGGGSNGTPTVSQMEMANRKKTPMSRILNERDYHYSYDDNDSVFKESFEERANRRKSQELLFPNLNSSFEFPSSKSKDKKNESFNNIRIPIITEYDTYMLPKSFCIKNYKKFVYEYLEADGKYSFKIHL